MLVIKPGSSLENTTNPHEGERIPPEALQEKRDESVAADRMSPEARATYDRIIALRNEIGPIDFDIVAELREMRGGGG